MVAATALIKSSAPFSICNSYFLLVSTHYKYRHHSASLSLLQHPQCPKRRTIQDISRRKKEEGRAHLDIKQHPDLVQLGSTRSQPFKQFA